MLLASALAAHPSLNVSTKTGYFTATTGIDTVNAGVLTEDEAAAGHSLAPVYVRWQTGRNRQQFGRDRLDLTLLQSRRRTEPLGRHPTPGQPGDDDADHAGHARQGPLPAAADKGLRLMASAPLPGGEVPGMVGQELADLIQSGPSPAQVCILAVACCRGMTNVLFAASGAPLWKEAASAVAQPFLAATQLIAITDVLASP